MHRVQIAAHAKTNLFLRILARETTGFHSIETLFALLELHDDVTIERTDGGIELLVEGADTGPTQENLAYRAADLVLGAAGREFGVRIHLEKAIPVQAGLGGGSSNAAATLLGTNVLTGNKLPSDEILRYAAQLGSDVPFFATRAAFALAWGRGERLLAISGPRSAPALIVKLDSGMSTRDAYELLAARRGEDEVARPLLLRPERFADWGSLAQMSANDFEGIVLDCTPGLGDLFHRLEETGPIITRLCGSGTAILAVYENTRKRDAALDLLPDVPVKISTRIRSAAIPEPVAL